MKITFLIGNGFDINLGLNTRYSDFYGYYKNNASSSSIILKLMKEDNSKDHWADLELALGEKLIDLREEDVDSFMDAHAELASLLLDYLEEEQKKYPLEKWENEIVSELARSLTELPNELNAEERRSYQTTCDLYKNDTLQYCFITFNYTDVLDAIIKKAKSAGIDLGVHTASNGRSIKNTLGEVHHVHGLLSEGVVLGVNDESQINNDLFRQHSLFKSIFLKSMINTLMGQRRTELAEEIIKGSQIICIFGMPIGITDKRWWEKIITWMVKDPNRKLIIYTRINERFVKRKIPTQIIRAREEVRRAFWEKGRGDQADDVYSIISNRIFVVFNSKIFSFPKV